MKNKVFEINVDFETKSAVDTDLIKIVKGDYNSIEFDLKMDKTDYKRAVLFLVKPSKKNFVVDIANSKAIFTKKNTFDEVGIYYYGIVLYGTNSKLTTSTKGKIQVVEGYNEDNEDITGDDNYPILDKLIEEVTDLKDKINASLGVMNKTFKEVTYDPSTGVMSFKNLNNEVTNINLPLSLLISSASYDNDNKKIVLTLANNDTIDIPILDLVSNYYDDKINANKEHIASTSNELYRLKTDVLETGESSGNNIHLEDSAWSEMQEISVDGVCEQKTRSGKNLFRGLTLSLTNSGLTSTYSDINSNEVTINGTTTKKRANISQFNDKILPAGTYTLSINKIQSFNVNIKGTYEDGTVWQYELSKGNTTKTFTAIMNIKTFYIFISDSTNFTANTTFKIELNEGSTASNEFDQYGASPSPDYPQEIKTLTGDIKLTSAGKNLLDYVSNLITSNNGLTSVINDDGSITTSGKPTSNYSTITKTIDITDILEDKSTYTISQNVPANLFVQINIRKLDGTLKYVNSNKGSSSFIVDKSIYSSYTLVIQTTSMETWGDSPLTITNKYMLCKETDTADTSFEPYQDSSLIIAIPSNEFIGKIDDTYKDTSKVVYKEDGHYHLILNKIIGKVVLDGSENWTNSDLNDKNFYYIMKTTINNMKSALNDNEKVPCLSNYFIDGYSYMGLGSMMAGTNGICIAQNNTLAICNNKYDKTKTTEYKQWLSTHNVEVYYPLETPYELDLGTVDQLLSYDEITNIFTDSDLLPKINVKYYRNFITTIRNLQINNDTLKNELSNIENRLATLENANTSVVNNNPTAESEVTE